MSIADLLEVAGMALFVVALGLLAAVLVPPLFAWPAGLSTSGAGFYLLSLLAARAGRDGGA